MESTIQGLEQVKTNPERLSPNEKFLRTIEGMLDVLYDHSDVNLFQGSRSASNGTEGASPTFKQVIITKESWTYAKDASKPSLLGRIKSILEEGSILQNNRTIRVFYSENQPVDGRNIQTNYELRFTQCEGKIMNGIIFDSADSWTRSGIDWSESPHIRVPTDHLSNMAERIMKGTEDIYNYNKNVRRSINVTK